MKTKKIKVRQGFTIVELVIVIGVIGVLTAVLVPTFINLNKKAEAASQQSFLKNVNTQLAMRQAEGGKLDTMYDAIEVADGMGFDVEKISPIDGNDIVYDNVAKRFAMMKGEEVTYSDGGIKGSGVEIWKIADSAEKAAALNTAGYSIYAKSSWNIGNLAAIKVGFDAGKNMTATSVSYTDSSTQAAIIRTTTGAIEINAPAGKVKHYGKADSVNITAIAPTSYHEKGTVGFAKIQTGRLVVEEEAKIDGVYLQDTAGSYNGIKIALVGKAELPAVARSEVSLENGDKKLVVELQTLSAPESPAAKQEYVWISKEADVVSSAVSSSETAIVPVETPSAAAETAKEEAKEAAAPVSATSSARVGAVGYETLESAIEAVPVGGQINVCKDLVISGSININKAMTIKGEGHSMVTVGTATSGNMAAFDVMDLSNGLVTFNIEDLTIRSTKHARVFLANRNDDAYFNVVNAKNLNVTTDGQAFYANGGAIINVRGSTVVHDGEYLAGKDPVYYSALIVGYDGTLNVYDTDVQSFGNGAATFPSGGTVNLYNTSISAFDDFADSNSGYVFWARHEKSYDTGTYKDYCGSAIINVYSGKFEGPYKVTDDGHTALNRIGAINIFGGTYQEDPSEYVQAPHTATQNPDGSWSVQ